LKQVVKRVGSNVVQWFLSGKPNSCALLDRLLHHAHTVPIAGKSYRLKHQRQAGMMRGNKSTEIG
jgi:hypothetical protein